MTQTSYFKEFIKYASLNVLGMMGISFYILADTFFISKGIGANGLAALNLAIPIYSFIHGCGLMLFFMIGFCFSRPVTEALGANEAIFSMTNTYLKVILLFSPAFIMNEVFLSFVRIKKAAPAQMISLLRGLLFIIPLAYVLSAAFGITGVWLAFPAAELMVSIIGIWFYHKVK